MRNTVQYTALLTTWYPFPNLPPLGQALARKEPPVLLLHLPVLLRHLEQLREHLLLEGRLLLLEGRLLLLLLLLLLLEGRHLLLEGRLPEGGSKAVNRSSIGGTVAATTQMTSILKGHGWEASCCSASVATARCSCASCACTSALYEGRTPPTGAPPAPTGAPPMAAGAPPTVVRAAAGMDRPDAAAVGGGAGGGAGGGTGGTAAAAAAAATAAAAASAVLTVPSSTLPKLLKHGGAPLSVLAVGATADDRETTHGLQKHRSRWPNQRTTASAANCRVMLPTHMTEWLLFSKRCTILFSVP